MYLLQKTPNTKTTFIQTTRLSNKLDFAKLKPFKILRVLKLIIYKLDFFNSIKIIKIRHILVLKSADPEAPLIKDISDIDPESQEKIWEVKEILDIKLINNS